MHKLILKSLVIVFFAGQVANALADPSQALNALLKGKFRYTFNQTCTYSPAGFSTEPPGGDVLGSAQTGDDFIQGVGRFNGDGTVTFTEKGIFQSHGGSYPGYFPITTYADICSGKYQVKADLSFSYEIDCTTTFITGFFTGQTVSVAGLKYEGQLDRLLGSYIVTAVSNAVQTQHFSDGHTNQRVCGGQSTAIRILW